MDAIVRTQPVVDFTLAIALAFVLLRVILLLEIEEQLHKVLYVAARDLQILEQRLVQRHMWFPLALSHVCLLHVFQSKSFAVLGICLRFKSC